MIEREVVKRWRGKQSALLRDTTTVETCVEGAIRSGKTTVCLWRELEALLAAPGIYGLLARWSEKHLFGLLVPLWRAACHEAGIELRWNARESYDEMVATGSRMYLRGLKSQDAVQRYAAFRGLTLSRAYIDQAEESAEDVYLELVGRLSQPGYAHQITISPQSVDQGHWIAKRFPETLVATPARRYVSLGLRDNAHNLGLATVERLEALYPEGHPKHRTLILGRRGMNVTGAPVYGGAFSAAAHRAPVAFNSSLPLEMALDFGKHHPCVVYRQVSAFGQVRFLAGVLGQDMYLDDFIAVVKEHEGRWFREAAEIKRCCDPAGTTDTSQGTRGAVTMLKAAEWRMRWVADSNSPAVRLAMVERYAAKMRKRCADRSESIQVNSDPERWLRVSATDVVQDQFVADGFEAGYVWSPHMVSVGRKQVRMPLKDGWYEHGMNCAEYLELNFGTPLKSREKDQEAIPRRSEPIDAYTGPMSWGL